MQVVILKPFPYAEDGIHSRELGAGAVVEIRDELVPGLKAERYVREAAAGETPPPVPVAAPAAVPAAEPALEAPPAAEVPAAPATVTEPRPRRARKA